MAFFYTRIKSYPVDLKQITKEDMKALFALRWGVEGGIKKLKPKMKLEKFGCRKQEGVYQDFYAHIWLNRHFGG